jgi:hypothetical protein
MKMKYLALAAIVSSIYSCAPVIKNFDSYQKQFMSKTQFMPNEEQLAGKTPSIVVFEFDENENPSAKQASLGKTVANGVENILTKNRLAKLVDRTVASKLEREIKTAEMNKSGSYKGPQIADYAISGAISNAGFSSEYKAGGTTFDQQTQQMVSTPPSFVYKAEVSGNLKIYELPSMAVVDNFEFSGSASRKENAQQSGGFAFGALKIGGQEAKGIERDDALVRKAGQFAVDSVELDVKNILAKRGFILEKRTFEDKVIFKISLGSADGIKHGDKLEISGQYESQNPITQKNEVEKRIIAKGIVADIIQPKFSWIVLEDIKKASEIRLGDSVQIKYKKGFASMSMNSFVPE